MAAADRPADDIALILETLHDAMQRLVDLQQQLAAQFDQDHGGQDQDALDNLMQEIQQTNQTLAEAEQARLHWAQRILPAAQHASTDMPGAFAAARDDRLIDSDHVNRAERIWANIRETGPELSRIIKQNSIILNRLDHYLGEQIDQLFQDRDGTRPVYGSGGQTTRSASDRRRSLGEA